ncbi:MAG: DUF4215 domain-containing protein [Polyangiaceae bacterium]|nr:DUF4215 domain-containing protein [Polyangiaceae bacterium]
MSRRLSQVLIAQCCLAAVTVAVIACGPPPASEGGATDQTGGNGSGASGSGGAGTVIGGSSNAGAGGGTEEAPCGNGRPNGIESCDDLNTDSGDGCDSTCQVEYGWFCNDIPSICAPSLKVSECPDREITGSEECDDGNRGNNDGCNSACEVELGFSCSGEPSVCESECGDRITAADEECDDGNADTGDGCDSCVVEEGASCTGVTCSLSCGDNETNGEEECDDGNFIDGDGCDSQCKSEGSFECEGGICICPESWLVEYDLADAEYHLRQSPLGMGDSEIGNQQSFDDEEWNCYENASPPCDGVEEATMFLRYQNDNGAFANGTVEFVSLTYRLRFTIRDVHSDLLARAGAVEGDKQVCESTSAKDGVVYRHARGTLQNNVITWGDDKVDDWFTYGTTVCRAGAVLCQMGDLKLDEVEIQDDLVTVPLKPFVLGGVDNKEITLDEAGVGAAKIGLELPPYPQTERYFKLRGTEVSRQLLPSPACVCADATQ